LSTLLTRTHTGVTARRVPRSASRGIAVRPWIAVLLSTVFPVAFTRRKLCRVRSLVGNPRWSIGRRDDVTVPTDLLDAFVFGDVELVGVQHRTVRGVVTHGVCYALPGKKAGLRSACELLSSVA
jgi:hypothetical protein